MFGLETLLAIIHHAEQLHMLTFKNAFEDAWPEV